MHREITITLLVLLGIFSIVIMPYAQAADLFAMKAGTEKCVSIRFGEDGGGEYTLNVVDPGIDMDRPWVDTHYTSYTASLSNIVSVPICFNTIGRSRGDQAVITVSLHTPTGGKVLEYGICVANSESFDEIPGSITGDVCRLMGKNTDIFTASFNEPEKYVAPGEEVDFTLTLDSLLPATLGITKASGEVTLAASKSSVDVGDGPVSVAIKLTAPQTVGDYPFSVMVAAQGCTIDDCRREVKGLLRVQEPEDQPSTGFLVWLTPRTKSVKRGVDTTMQLTVSNYGNGQGMTFDVSVPDGVETNFARQTLFVEKGGSKSVTVTLRVTAEDGTSFKVTGLAENAEGKSRSSVATLKVDEMSSDADLLDADFDDEDAGLITLGEWEDFKTDASDLNVIDNTDDGTVTNPQPDYTIYIMAVLIIAAVGLIGFYFYKKSQSGEGGSGPSWEDLGLKS